MIDGQDLGRALFDVTLEPNAAARLAPPPESGLGNWWKLGGATWIRVLPKQSVQVQKPDEAQLVEVRFRADGPGLEADENADWVWAEDAVKGLAAELILGILRQLDAAVPALPARARSLSPEDPQLDWPRSGVSHPEDRRRRRLARSVSLADYLGRIDQTAGEVAAADPEQSYDLADRLIRHLSAIPRPAEARIFLSWNAPEDDPVLSWEQKGDPELLWGASELSYDELSRNVAAARLPPEEAGIRCRLGACGHLFAMGSAVEAATGGLAVPIRLRYRTVGARPVTATLTVAPSQWGFDIPRMVQAVGQGQIPDGLGFGTTR